MHPAAAAACTGAAGEPDNRADLHEQLLDLLQRFDVNDYAASVKVYAVKPKA